MGLIQWDCLLYKTRFGHREKVAKERGRRREADPANTLILDLWPKEL